MRLLKKDEVLTLGAAERDLDWEAMWRAELAKDDRPSDRPKGARLRSNNCHAGKHMAVRRVAWRVVHLGECRPIPCFSVFKL
jgi:hypothetical protein